MDCAWLAALCSLSSLPELWRAVLARAYCVAGGSAGDTHLLHNLVCVLFIWRSREGNNGTPAAGRLAVRHRVRAGGMRTGASAYSRNSELQVAGARAASSSAVLNSGVISASWPSTGVEKGSRGSRPKSIP
eukprot:scaffold9034_cov124-Isochrysis_galbana.AAC.5